MRCRLLAMALLVPFWSYGSVAAQEARWWDKHVEDSLTQAKDNRKELEKALHNTPKSQRPGMAFLISNMPDADLQSLKADFLLSNTALAYKARAEAPWGKDIPEAVFLNDVLQIGRASCRERVYSSV